MQTRWRRHISVAGAAALVASLSLGCETLGLIIGFEEQAEMARANGRIDGRIDTAGRPAEGPLVIALGREPENEGDPLIGVDSFVRIRPGTFRFGVPAGKYRLGAYEDRNENGLLDPEERVSINRQNPLIDLAAGEHHTQDITLQPGKTFAEFSDEPVDVLSIVKRTPREQRHFSLWAFSIQGEVCEDLDDPKFGPEAGPRGLWEIMDFLTAGIAGVYFMEPYDPKRIPVLFVHGIGGYPQEFSTLIGKLDRNRYQPWFYFYPSGFSLDALSTHLATMLERLAVEQDFDEIAVVAHSMGGLVSRGAIIKYQRETQRDDVKLFVSISTPWGGDVNAKNTEDAPIELPPSFYDMDPSSDYLKWIFYDEGQVRRLPRQVDYHMMFGFKMSDSKPVADDGTVTVASQTRTEVQDEAITQRAYDNSHVGILHSPDVLERLHWLLDQRFD